MQVCCHDGRVQLTIIVGSFDLSLWLASLAKPVCQCLQRNLARSLILGQAVKVPRNRCRSCISDCVAEPAELSTTTSVGRSLWRQTIVINKTGCG
ncbi:hypothetical protein IG631_10376 [Alternaria alternata]|nr:hypothetical protein IG631_10376 [Alternaria alternata]